jgi:hypothetical protein
VARRAHLSAGAGWRLAALLAIVVLVHVLALDWIARRLEETPVLRPLATPMFTRLLRPEAPVAAAPAPPPRKPAAARPKRPTVAAITKPTGALPPAPSASAPQPPPQPEAQPSQEPASSSESTTAAATPPAPEPELAPAIAPDPAQPASAASAAPASTLDSWPADTRLSYRLGGQYRGSGEFHGNARVQWQREGDRYQTKVDIVLTALTTFVMTSQGEVTPLGLLPRVYEEQRAGGPRGARLGDETIALANGSTVPRPPGVQDSASQFVDLSHRFASGKDVLEVGRSVSYWMARPGAVDLWTYDIVGKEMLQSSELGSFEAFHLKPRPIANPRGNITVEMWFAPSLQYLPVRIRVNMGEATYLELTVVKIEQR